MRKYAHTSVALDPSPSAARPAPLLLTLTLSVQSSTSPREPTPPTPAASPITPKPLHRHYACFDTNQIAATSSHTDSGRHGASPAQVRDKTEPSHHPLFFPPNSKTSRALNHRQSNLQETPVCQPCPPAIGETSHFLE